MLKDHSAGMSIICRHRFKSADASDMGQLKFNTFYGSTLWFKKTRQLWLTITTTQFSRF